MQPRTNPITDGRPAPHENVNALLRVLQGEVTRILAPALVGMYLSGPHSAVSRAEFVEFRTPWSQ